jgi:hypothetical protein
MIPLGIMVLPALIRSLVLYMSFFTSSTTSKNDHATLGRTMKFHVDYSSLFREGFECLALSYAMTWLPMKLSILSVCLIIMFASPMVLCPLRSSERQFDYFQFILLLMGSALLGCLSLLNYSMACLVTFFIMPCYLVAGFSKIDHWFIKYCSRFLFLTFLNPLVFLALYHYLTRILTIMTLVLPDFLQFFNDFDAYIASCRLLNVWTVDVICLTIVPLWFLLYRSTFWIRV